MYSKKEHLRVADDGKLVVDLDLDAEFWRMDKFPKALWKKVRKHIRRADRRAATKEAEAEAKAWAVLEPEAASILAKFYQDMAKGADFAVARLGGFPKSLIESLKFCVD